jgi:hypothetical protein
MNDRLQLFEQKIEEYFFSCYPEFAAMPDTSFLAQWPLYKFSIVRLHAALAATLHDEQLAGAIGEKLIDIKLHYAYLLTITPHFYRGTTVIVGNNEIEKLNPRTISLLRGTHYRVYLLSVLKEQTLDLLWLVHERKPSNYKKGKWNKILEHIQTATGSAIVTADDSSLLLQFKEQFRTAEMHKSSMIRALTGKPQWTHLQEEESAASRVLAQLYAYHVQA